MTKHKRKAKSRQRQRESHLQQVVYRQARDPYAIQEIGKPPPTIPVAVSTRDNPLEAMLNRGHIDQCQFEAALYFRGLLEAAEGDALRGQDTTREPVQGGKLIELFTQRRTDAVNKLKELRSQLGKDGDWRLRQLIGQGMTVSEMALAVGLPTERGRWFVGQSIRNDLDVVAGYAGLA